MDEARLKEKPIFKCFIKNIGNIMSKKETQIKGRPSRPFTRVSALRALAWRMIIVSWRIKFSKNF